MVKMLVNAGGRGAEQEGPTTTKIWFPNTDDRQPSNFQQSDDHWDSTPIHWKGQTLLNHASGIQSSVVLRFTRATRRIWQIHQSEAKRLIATSQGFQYHDDVDIKQNLFLLDQKEISIQYSG